MNLDARVIHYLVVTLNLFSVLRIGFTEDDYEGLEDNPNSPCVVTATTDTILEIPLQVRLTPSAVTAKGKKCNILTNLQVVCFSAVYLLYTKLTSSSM